MNVSALRGLLLSISLTGLLTGCASTPRGGSGDSGGPRLNQIVGESRTQARLVLEIDPRQKPVGPATLHTFNLAVEERIVAVDKGGAAIEARLVEAVGASGEPQLSDQLALALDDLKVSFRRTDRGEVQGLKIDGVHPPLDAPTARAVVSALFGAGRGACLPGKSIGLQDDWTVESDDQLVGLTAHLRHFYTLLEKRAQQMRIRAKGKIEAIGSISATRRQVEGETFSDEIFDLDRGVVTSGEYEWTLAVKDEPTGDIPGMGRTRVRAERGLAVQPKKKL